MRTEEEICADLTRYIESGLRNRPSVLGAIKRVERTPKIIDMVFSRPDVFRLDSEIKNVPKELLTDEILVKYILSRPESIALIPEEAITIPVLVAFEFARRRFERLSAMTWGRYREKIEVPKVYKKYRDDICSLCDSLPSKHYDEEVTKDYLHYIDKMCSEIIVYCSGKDELNQTNPTNSKYRKVDFGISRRIFIFISGYPDSGKSYFSNILGSFISHSMCFDSDMLLEKNLIGASIQQLVRDEVEVVIFSDIYASRFFSQEELKGSYVFNIIVEPASIELMYRNSKYMQGIPYRDYKKYEINSIRYDDRESDVIHVENDYTDRILTQIDVVLDEILSRLDDMGEKPRKVELEQAQGKAFKIKKLDTTS